MEKSRRMFATQALASDFATIEKTINGLTGLYDSHYCGFKQVQWSPGNDWACSFCNMVNHMGVWKNDTVEIYLPRADSFSVIKFFDNTNARKLVAMQYLVQYILGEENTAGYFLAAARCSGSIVALQVKVKHNAWKGMSYLLNNVLEAWEKLKVYGWSHTRAFDSATLMWNKSGSIGFQNLDHAYWGVDTPASWVSSDLAFRKYMLGKGYAGYTKICFLLVAAKHIGAAIMKHSAWKAAFGEKSQIVYDRTYKFGTEDRDAVRILDTITCHV